MSDLDDWRKPPGPGNIGIKEYNPPKMPASETSADRLDVAVTRGDELEKQLEALKAQYIDSVNQNQELRQTVAQFQFHLRSAERTIKLLNRALENNHLLE